MIEVQEHRVNLATLRTTKADEAFGPSCICGASMEWVGCYECGGDGAVNRFDEDPLWYGTEAHAWRKCEICKGNGGWYWCTTLPRED